MMARVMRAMGNFYFYFTFGLEMLGVWLWFFFWGGDEMFCGLREGETGDDMWEYLAIFTGKIEGVQSMRNKRLDEWEF